MIRRVTPRRLHHRTLAFALTGCVFLFACDDTGPHRAAYGAKDAGNQGRDAGTGAAGDAGVRDGAAKLPDAGGMRDGAAKLADAGTFDAGCGGRCPLDPAIEARIDALLAQMTVDEKVAEKHGTGSVDGLWVASELDRLGIPGYKMVDGPRGVAAYVGNATTFPVASLRGATWDPALEKRVGEAIGLEVAALGGNVLLAPVINNLRHPRWGRAQETYGEDAFHLGRMGVGFVEGVQQHVLASAKHFAAYSIENSRFGVDVVVDERTLREQYLPHFQAVVEEANVASVMSSYNRVNGDYCGENAHLLHDILEGEWGFQGFVESDWDLGTQSTVPSALAGLDVEMPYGRYFDAPLLAAVDGDAGADAAAGDGGQRIPLAVIDESVRRILRRMFEYHLDAPGKPSKSAVESPEHEALAQEVAEKGIVLLKNDSGALPLDRTKVHSLAVVGELSTIANLGDHGSSNVTSSITVSPLKGIERAAGDVAVTSIPGDTLSPDDAMAVASTDAAVVVVGLTYRDEGEYIAGTSSGDRKNLTLSNTHVALVQAVAAVNPRTIVVLEGGSAITVEDWIDGVKGLVFAFYPGAQGGNAIAEVLFGDVNPSGKLPFTVPVSEAQLPPFDNVSRTVTYGFFHGYRYVDHDGDTPRFPFGYGLSYTTFAYSNLRLSSTTMDSNGSVTLSADVTNSGSMAGDEIAELYVTANHSAVERAVRDLKGFRRIHLEPKQTATVSFALRAADVAYYDVMKASWTVERTDYTVAIGSSSRMLPLSARVTIR